MKKISKNFPPVKKYKIAIFFEEDYLGVYPSLINGIRFLANEGHTIDIIGTSKKSDFPPPPKFEGNVTFRNLAQNYKRDRKYENEIEEKFEKLEESQNSLDEILEEYELKLEGL